MLYASLYNEKEVVQQLSEGSEMAFGQLYESYSKRLYGNLLKLVKSEELAQEILQDTFVRIWDNRHSLNTDQSFRSYLFKIAQNLVYDFFRKAAKDKNLAAQLMTGACEDYTHIEEEILRKENVSLLQQAIQSLPQQRQRVFTLCKLEGKSYEEVSKELAISTSTISDHIVKATKAIKEYYYLHQYFEYILIAAIFKSFFS